MTEDPPAPGEHLHPGCFPPDRAYNALAEATTAMSASLRQYAGRTTVTDGAWGTELQRRGLPPESCPDAWNLGNPAAVESVARDYVQAGSQVILTNTFRSSPFVLAQWHLAERAAEIVQAGAAISRRAAGQEVAVFGSIGPSGKIVMMGDVAPEELASTFAAQAAALARGGVDAILCETFTELAELLLAVGAAREATDLPIVASMTFDAGPEKTATIMGTRPGEFVKAAVEAGAAAVGANCGAGPEQFVKVAALLAEATELPVWVKPNAGMPVLRDRRTVFPMGPEEFAGHVPALAAAGACILGGCCGTTPEHIRLVREAVARLAP